MSTAQTWCRSISTSTRRLVLSTFSHSEVFIQAACHCSHAPLQKIYGLRQTLHISTVGDMSPTELLPLCMDTSSSSARCA